MLPRPFLLALAVLTLPLLALAAHAQTAPAEDPGMIVQRFIDSGSRETLLKELQTSVAANAASWYKDEFPSLIAALQHEPPPPVGYDKPAAQRSPEQSLAASIYDLRDESHSWQPRTTTLPPSLQLVQAGPAAIEPLLATLDDDTPVRQLGPEKGLSLNILLRRSDLALSCIEQISAITFFRRTQGRGGYFHNDAQRPSVTANVRAWWQQAKGKSQADGIRVQLSLWPKNTTLASTSHIEPELLFTLTRLEPPDRVIEPLRALCAADTMGLNSSITEGMLQLDPQYVLRLVFERLANRQLRAGDYTLLLKYGDKKIYQELARRATEDNALDPSSWIAGEQAQWAARYGRNWALPIIAAVLSQTQMTGSRSFGGPAQRFCAADDAVVVFQELTLKDFGYHRDDPEPARLAAIKAARDWWLAEGRTLHADTVNADHPSLTDGTDLRATDAQLTATAALIASPDPATARPAIAALGHVYSFRVQQALLTSLAAEPDPAQRILILQKLDQPAYWHIPTLAALFERDPALPVRIAAAANLLAILRLDNMYGGRRLETRDTLLTTTRRLADASPPASPSAELRLPLLRLLIANSSPEDTARIRTLATQPPAPPALSDPDIKKYLDSLNAQP